MPPPRKILPKLVALKRQLDYARMEADPLKVELAEAAMNAELDAKIQHTRHRPRQLLADKDSKRSG